MTASTTPRTSDTRSSPRPERGPGLGRRIVHASLPYQLLTFAVFAACWELYAELSGGLLVPSFTETVRATFELLGSAQLWHAMYVSNQALLLGFGLAVGVGVPAGILLGRFRPLERFADVYLNILLVTPMAAIIPLLVMSVGFGLASRVILVAIFSIVMVVVNSRAGVRQVDPSLIEMARSFGATERRIWIRVLLPGALPAIMTGVRLGLGRAITGMVIVELMMVSTALGGLILEYRGLFKAPLLYGTIVVILTEALLLISFARWGERKLTRWAHTQTARRT